jgi:exodeoxyribonuclease VII large subunit
MTATIETGTLFETKALTVSAYAARLGKAVRDVGGGIVEGEVQKPQRTRTGLLYFEITDGEARLTCKVFKKQIERLKHEPSEGDLVKVRVARPDFWPGAGRLSLIVSDIELAGVGELLRQRAELLKKLKAEGLCDPDRRKPLPAFPRAVGVIAGKGSEGMSDVIRALHDRLPHAHIVTCPALVQGKSAPRDIIDALATLQEHQRVDVIVIARGGGSVQDLIAFDDERLCRAVFACSKPIVAAIGHTNNIPVCNYVTHAASTPSRSAEMVVPSLAEIRKDLAFAQQALDRVPARVEESAERVKSLGERLRIAGMLESMQMGIRDLGHRITQAETTFFATREEGLARAGAVLEAIPHRCEAAFANCEQKIAEQRLRLGRVPQRTKEVAGAASEQMRMLSDGIKRQLEDHERDYGRAIDRLLAEFNRAALRRLDEEGVRLTQSGQLMRERVDRRLGNAEHDLKHTTALIEARDFSKHGFVLATDAAGKPLPSIAGVGVGANLNLRFRDGDAGVTVREIKENER